MLAIRCAAPFFLPLSDGLHQEFAVLLPDFGGKNGMLLASDIPAVVFAAATVQGYGVSCIDPGPNPSACLQDYIDCLLDWGWSGSGKAPEWYRED